jgi:hypothetical protein
MPQTVVPPETARAGRRAQVERVAAAAQQRAEDRERVDVAVPLERPLRSSADTWIPLRSPLDLRS